MEIRTLIALSTRSINSGRLAPADSCLVLVSATSCEISEGSTSSTVAVGVGSSITD